MPVPLQNEACVGVPHLRRDHRGPELRRRSYMTPAYETRRRQAARIPVDIDHDHRPRGQVIDLQLRGRYLWGICHTDGVAIPGPFASIMRSPSFAPPPASALRS